MTKRKLPDPNDPTVKRMHALFDAAVARGEITEDLIAWKYAQSLWRFEHGEREEVDMWLELALRGGPPVPIGLQDFMVDVALGRRKPGRKLKCSAAVGLKAAFDLSDVLDAEDKIRANANAEADRSRGAAMADGHIARIASSAGTIIKFKGAREPADIIADSEARVAAAKERIAAEVGIAVSTLESLERDYRAFLLRGGV